MPSTPVSVMLPDPLRSRLSRQAQSRSLKLSTAIKVLLDERLQELEAEDRLTRAEEWQRAQVWASWERFRAGKNPEVPWEEIAGLFDEALGRKAAPTRSAPPRPSRPTSRRRSRG
ncbi:MAG TPA: hypothetical protein VND93_00630 [Myxococcales bacterium]|nr:hypothetical protein [Myxococcales bacterium]